MAVIECISSLMWGRTGETSFVETSSFDGARPKRDHKIWKQKLFEKPKENKTKINYFLAKKKRAPTNSENYRQPNSPNRHTKIRAISSRNPKPKGICA